MLICSTILMLGGAIWAAVGVAEGYYENEWNLIPFAFFVLGFILTGVSF